MKVKINSKKGLKASLSVLVDKKIIQKKLDEKLNDIKGKVQLKGFRPGKVPVNVIKNQFGKAIYGEVIDTILKDTSTKAIEENKLKVAGQPKIDLKTFGEGKDLDYTIEVETLPDIKLTPLEKINTTEYEVMVDNQEVEKRLNEISKSQQNFKDKDSNEKSENGDMVIFDYNAKIDGKDFEGNEGKKIQLILGRDLFIKGFDEQLLGLKKNDSKLVTVNLPPNYPKKELINKKTVFNCKISQLRKPTKNKIDDEFAKKMGAKNIIDLKDMIKKQISNEYKNALDGITKKNILDQLEKKHSLELPPNLIEQEIKILNQGQKKDDVEKNINENNKLAKSRIKVGLILNEIAQTNKIQVSQDEIKNEIIKQTKNMPGQEKMVAEYYQKNPSALSSLRGALYEDKIIKLIKSKIKLNKKKLNLKEAEDVIKTFNKNSEPERKKSDNKKNQKKLKINKKK